MRYGKALFALAVLAGGLLHATAARAQDRAVSFANMRFGTTPAIVLETMKGLKLTPLANSPDQLFPLDQRFEGDLKGRRVVLSALHAPDGRLEKILIAFVTPDEDCVPLFRALKTELLQEYGTPVVDLERWDYPYSNGGHIGQEHFALRVGRGLLAAAWDRMDAGTSDGGVSLTTSETMTVRLAYESSRWTAESERRRRILTAELQGPFDQPGRH